MIPHFTFPFHFGQYNDQDTVDDVAACVQAVLSCPRGFRSEKPDFGISDQAFLQGGANLAELRSAVLRWESRADADIDQTIVDAIDTVRVAVKESQ